MKRILMLVVPLAFVLTVASPVPAQDTAAQIVGVWKLKSWENTEIESKKVYKAYGETPNGYYVFTKGGRVFSNVFDSNRVPPAADAPTDAERAALFRSMLVSTGTYKLDGNKLTYTYDGSWIQRLNGTSQVRIVEIKGNTLTYSAPAARSNQTGLQVVFTAVFEKVE